MAVLSVVATREGIATRHSALQDAAGDEVAAAFTPSTENAFDAAVQGATADDALATPAASEWTTVTVRPGQTLSDIFDEEGLGFSAAMAIAHLGGAASQLQTLRPGERSEERGVGTE